MGITAPVSTSERIAWLSRHCVEFVLEVKQHEYRLWASMCRGDEYYGSAGPVDDLAEAIDECFYDFLPGPS